MTECKVIKGGESFRGKQGLDYFAGVSAQSANASGICMHLVVLPPGAKAKPHFHERHETAIYALEGATEMHWGPKLEHHLRLEAGDYLYIPAGVPHLPYNPTDRVAKAILARTDPNEQESVVLVDIVPPERVG